MVDGRSSYVGEEEEAAGENERLSQPFGTVYRQADCDDGDEEGKGKTEAMNDGRMVSV